MLCWPLLTPGLSGQSYLMEDGLLIEDCDGFFLDSGGGNGDYGANENFTATLCSDNSSGTHVQLVFSGVELADGDELCFYDGEDTGATQLSCADNFEPGDPFIIQATAANSSGCLTIQFISNAAEQGTGWSADINCVPACQLIQAELVSADPEVMPQDTGWIDACPGERIFFSGAGMYPQDGVVYNHSDLTSEFFWDFGDGTQAVGPDVSHVYEESGGYTVQLTIVDQFGCTNTNFLNQRVRVATRPDFNIGGTLDPEICAGDTVQLNALVNGINPEVNVSVQPTEGSFQTAGVRSDSLPLPDGTGASFSTSVGFTDFSPGQVLTDITDLLSICVNMEHSWMHDLEITLSCPSGETVILHNYIQTDTEGAGQTFLGVPNDPDNSNAPNTVQTPWGPIEPGIGWEYCWTPDAVNGTWREYATANVPGTLPPGDYSAYDSLEDLLGCPLNGEWTITVTDLWGIDNGFIFSWGIEFAPELYPSLETFTPAIVDYNWISNPSIYFQTQDSIAASPVNAGTASYTFNVLDEYGCNWDTTVNIAVLPETHPDCYNCGDNLSPVNDTLICEGEAVTLDVEAEVDLETDVVFETFPLYTLGNQNHPPNNPYVSPIDINSINPAVITDPQTQILSVCLDMETDWNGDMRFFLEAPNGAILELSTGNGGNSDNYTNTCFTPAATVPITAGTGPFTGDFQPEGDWNDLIGAPVNGPWQLLVSDAFGPTVFGQLNSWSITFQSTNEVTYTWSPAGALSCDDCPAPLANPLTTTPFIVESNDSYNCVYSDTITVGVINELDPPQVSCEITGEGELTFTWSPLDGVAQYEVRVTIGGNPTGWQGPVPGESFVVDGLSDETGVTVEVRPYLADPPLDCDLPVGTATCLYEDCQLSLLVTEPTVPVSCFGLADGQVTVSASNGLEPYSYFIEGDPNVQDNGLFANLSAGTYIFAVTDGEGCIDTAQVTVPQPDSLLITLSEVQPIACFGGSDGALLAETQGGEGTLSFAWDHDDTLTGSQAAGLAAGTYGVTVTDENDCSASTDLILEQPDSLILELLPMSPTCFNSDDGAVMTTVSGGSGDAAFAWNNAANTPDVQDLGAGQYCVTVTDANGCAVTDCVELTAPDPIEVESLETTEPLCFGDATGAAALVVIGGAGDFSYLWNDELMQINPTAVDLEAGAYEVLITDANGCQLTETVEIGQPEALTAVISPTDANCNGGIDGAAGVVVEGGAGGYTYAWSSGSTEPEATDLAAGEYFLTVTDANGCTLIEQTSIGEPEMPLAVELEQLRLSCYEAGTGEVTASATGGTPGYTFAWSNGQNTALATGLAATEYTVTVTDAQGCATEQTIVPEQYDPIQITVSVNIPTCNGYADGALAVTIVDGGAGEELTDYSFVWNTGQTGTFLQDMPGGVAYTVTATDSQGCSSDTTRFLNQPDPITFDLSSTSARCAGSADGAATVSNLEGEFDLFSFAWSDGQTDTTATGLTAGIYELTVTDPVGCFSFGSVEVTEPFPLRLDWDAERNSCYNGADGAAEAFAGGGTPGYTFTWSNGGTGRRLESLGAGDYDLTVTDANGCEETTVVTVEQPDPLTAELATQDVSCAGDRNGRIDIAPSGGTPPYLFSTDNRDFNGISNIIGLTAGEYDIFVRDNNGCTFQETVAIDEPDPFQVEAGDDIYVIVMGDSLQLTGVATNNTGAVEFVWTASYPGTLSCTECSVTTAFPENQISYELYGIDSLGCEATDRVTVLVEKPRVVAVPTGFTPNGDGENDRLIVHGQEGTRVTSFQVYDRWGELLYESADFGVNDRTAGWDGSFRGEPASAGVYVWFVQVEYIDGVVETFKGQTTLLR